MSEDRDAEIARDLHLAWCKLRALEYVDRGDLGQAIDSMGSDLMKHPHWKNGKLVGDMVLLAHLFEKPKGPAAIRRWIEGFR